jgi:acyl-CoA synthetase (NDP forming)
MSRAPAIAQDVRRDNLRVLFDPRSIAIVGASGNPNRLSGKALSYLKESTEVPVYPVNPNRSEVQGVPAYASLGDLPDVPEVALILLPAELAVEAAETAAELGVSAVVIHASGFSEIGPTGRVLQDQLTDLSSRSDMRILGPNTNGLVAVRTGSLLTFAGVPDPLPKDGSVAVISQSGAVGSSLFGSATAQGLRVGYFCGTGNEADITVTDLVEEMVDRPEVSMVLVYSETVRDARRLLAVAGRARELDKAILFVKVGGSDAGERAALSHTGSLAGSDAAVDAAFAQHGILRPKSLAQMVRWAVALQSSRRPGGRRVGVLTPSGGMGIMLADAAEDAGLVVPELSASTQRAIRDIVPEFAGTSNPVDVTGQIVNDRELLDRTLAVLDACDDVDVLALVGLGGRGTLEDVERATTIASRAKKPCFAWSADPLTMLGLRRAGIPAYGDSVEVMDAISALVRHHEFTGARVSDEPPATAGAPPLRSRGLVLEHDARRFLGAYGVPQLNETTATTQERAVAGASSIGYPVALKALSYDYVHKAENGAVRLDLNDANALAEAFGEMHRDVSEHGHRIEVFLVQEMVPRGLELILGVRRDPVFGPMVTIGLGGSLVEVLAQVATRPALMTREDAGAALDELCAGRLLTARGGITTEQRDCVADLMVAVGRAVTSHDEIVELDLNPVVITAGGIYVVDAVIVTGGD